MQWQRAIITHFMPYVRADKAFLIMLSVLSLIMVGANTLLIWKFGEAISLIAAGKFDSLTQTLLIIAGIVLLNQIIQFIYSYTYQKITLRFVDRVRGQLLAHIMKLSFPIMRHFEKGDLISRLNNDVDRLLTYVINVPINLFSNVVVLIFFSSMLFWIDWRLTLLALAMAPLFFLSQQYVAPKTGRASRHFVQEKANLLTIEEQTLANLRGISGFNSETVMRDKHRTQFDIARSWALKVRKIRILYNSFFTVMLYLAGVVVVYTGISSIKSGQLTIGVFVSFLIYIRYLTGPVRSIAGVPTQLHASRAAAERVMEVFHLQP
jgi:ATP-binding cassette subfamily B protein